MPPARPGCGTDSRTHKALEGPTTGPWTRLSTDRATHEKGAPSDSMQRQMYPSAWVGNGMTQRGREESADQAISAWAYQHSHSAYRSKLDEPPGLSLRGFTLTEVPVRLQSLVELTHLDLSGNAIRALPVWLGRLENLQRLNVSSNQLDALPTELAQLSSLVRLDLSDNRLTRLPVELAQLTSLERLNISHNSLTEIPGWLSRLTQLRGLYAVGNEISAIHGDISQLALTHLNLTSNRLLHLPARLSELSRLELLQVADNRLGRVPESIGELRSLTHLDLSRNEIANLPSTIGGAQSLRTLDIRHNRLRRLPPELGNLERLEELRLDGNQLEEPLPLLAERGTRSILDYLRSLEDGLPSYECKLLIVGEGNVGKSSLLARLRDEPFIEGRPTTHGIDRKVLRLPYPTSAEDDITLNAWDFGGQEVYRITHQFFYSTRAVYLVVWRPREGQEEGAVEAWMRRISLRVGDGARIIVVATHGDERRAELDTPHLREKYGSQFVGHVVIDSLTGMGIQELRELIATTCAELPQVGQLISSRWQAVRRSLRALQAPTAEYGADYLPLAARYGLDPHEARTVIEYLHDVGDIVYFGEDDGLRSIITLHPEWLTKAIGYVLEDTETRAAGGELEHSRLAHIWGGGTDVAHAPYPHELHPFFLRLMEKFDVSYRIPDREASLVAQLVPFEKPAYHFPAPRQGLRTLRLRVELADEAPGLVPWLIVRLHRFSTGMHWRSGVSLYCPEHESCGLIELGRYRKLDIVVRAPSPVHMFSIIRDTAETILKSRWPGLRYELRVPCERESGEGVMCGGDFPLHMLEGLREREIFETFCQSCVRSNDVGLLLTGFRYGREPLSISLADVRDQLDQIEELAVRTLDSAAEARDSAARAADTAAEIRAVRRAVEQEVADCPYLLSLEPHGYRWADPRAVWRERLRLRLWCQHPGHEHPCTGDGYDLEVDREWFRAVVPALRTSMKVLTLLPLASGGLGLADALTSGDEASAQLNAVRASVDTMTEIAELSEELDPTIELDLSGSLSASSFYGASLRVLRSALHRVDPSGRFQGLRRFMTPEGDFIWVCGEHESQYDPGLVRLSYVRPADAGTVAR